MSMQVKPGYTNPLLMMKEHGKGFKFAQGTNNGEKGANDKVKELQVKQFELQSEMLLMKSTGTDSSGNSAEKLEKMEARLSEVNDDLRAAKKDYYVREDKNGESAGIYQVKEKDGKRVVTAGR